MKKLTRAILAAALLATLAVGASSAEPAAATVQPSCGTAITNTDHLGVINPDDIGETVCVAPTNSGSTEAGYVVQWSPASNFADLTECTMQVHLYVTATWTRIDSRSYDCRWDAQTHGVSVFETSLTAYPGPITVVGQYHLTWYNPSYGWIGRWSSGAKADSMV